jgi:leucine-rich repeat-containing G protein-coupled receptor 8
MGIYLMIIAGADLYYRGDYIVYDQRWRLSGLCQFAGFLSTFSCEFSVLTLTVITLDRLVSITLPLRFKRMTMKEARIILALLWVASVILAGVPLLRIDYFNKYYARSGVCLALHITPDQPPGWEYSVFVFIVINFACCVVIGSSYLRMFIAARQSRAAVRASSAKKEREMAQRMCSIVMTDFACWVPIIILGIMSLAGIRIPPQVCPITLVSQLLYNCDIYFDLFLNQLLKRD